MMLALEFNNNGVIFLQNGYRRAASIMFAGALDILVQASQWQPEQGPFCIQDTPVIVKSRRTLGTCHQEWQKHGEDKTHQTASYSSPELNLLFTQAISLEYYPSSDLSDVNFLVPYSAAVIFNKALAGYHLAAYDDSVRRCSEEPSQHQHLMIALQLYEKSNEIIMDAQPELPYTRKLHRKLAMVCLNNIAHLHIELTLYEESLDCLERLAMICLEGDDEDNRMKEQLLLNCTVMKTYRCAATA